MPKWHKPDFAGGTLDASIDDRSFGLLSFAAGAWLRGIPSTPPAVTGIVGFTIVM